MPPRFPRFPPGGVGIRAFSATVGDGSATDITVTHNLGTRDVSVTLRQVTAPYAMALTGWEATDPNNVTLRFAVAPSSAQYRVTIQG